MKISRVCFSSAPAEQEEKGIFGFISFVIDGALRVDSVVLRRRADGGRTLSFPSKADSSGVLHPILWPISDAARMHIEHEVFRAIGYEDGARR